MSTFLLVWNPKKFRWDSIEDWVREFQEKGRLILDWSCGSRKNVPVGSRVFLVRVGENPKGMVASGRTIRAPYKKPGKKALYVDFEVDSFSSSPIVQMTELERAVSAQFKWAPQGSGIEIPPVIAGKLERCWKKSELPNAKAYQAALRQVSSQMTEKQKALLIAQYHFPNSTATATQLAISVGSMSHKTVNSSYGQLGRLFRRALRLNGLGQQSYVLSSFYQPSAARDKEWRFVMHPQLAIALERLGWVNKKRASRKHARKEGRQNASVLHVLVGDAELDYGSIKSIANKNSALDWVVPKDAAKGQHALFYCGPYGFVAKGVILSDAKKVVSRGKPQYRASVGNIQLLATPVPLRHLQAMQPKWKWASYPRSYTTVDGRLAISINRALKMCAGKLNKSINSTVKATEGVRSEVVRSTQGRSGALRQAALNSASGVCEACSKDFSQVLDGLGIRVLQVHHRKQLATLRVPKVNGLQDLAVVCANCHMLIHSDPKKALKVEKLRQLLQDDST